MSIMLAAREEEVAGAERVDPDLRPLLDHIAAELAQEYIRLMEAAANEDAAATALLGFVSAGVGIAPIPDMISRTVRNGVVVRAVDPPLPARTVLAALPADYRSPAAAAMLDILHELSATWTAQGLRHRRSRNPR